MVQSLRLKTFHPDEREMKGAKVAFDDDAVDDYHSALEKMRLTMSLGGDDDDGAVAAATDEFAEANH
jgi:hypothetical protein